jgi:alkylhydroperoxidase/carboxymuconolactone decarboxylase family protein YurZ
VALGAGSPFNETAMTDGNADKSREALGADAYASQLGMTPDGAVAWFRANFGDRFAGEAMNAAAGAWVDDCLSPRDRSLIVVASLISQGGVTERLRTHVRWAIAQGSNREELEALVTLLAVYVGYPKASVAMEIVRTELSLLDGEGATS